MPAAKPPLSPRELAILDEAARKLDRDSMTYKLYQSLRYTGMHSCCLYRPEANVRKVGDEYKWSRPKKGAQKGVKGLWAEVGGVPVHHSLTVDIETFYKDNLRKRRSYGAWKVYIYTKIHDFALDNDIPGVSPNSLRHTVAVVLGRELDLPKGDVAEMLGCSIKTLEKHYETLGPRTRKERMRAGGW